jgi:hypothetical protein
MRYGLSVVLCVAAAAGLAQVDAVKLLQTTNAALREDPVAAEMLLDLVKVGVTDSVMTRKTQHHRVPLGFLLPAIGIKWQYLDTAKQKFVGTVTNSGVYALDFFSEHDVILDVASHLPHYQELAYQGYKAQKDVGRAKGKHDYGAAPFDTLPTATNWAKYKLHCELTPAKERRPLLDSLFFLLDEGERVTDHPNFWSQHLQVGLYGAFCMDCNHDCHPEIHPYEIIWWLDLNQPDDVRKWFVGTFQEGSNRFPKWSRYGSARVSIPFHVDAGKNVTIAVEQIGQAPLVTGHAELQAQGLTVYNRISLRVKSLGDGYLSLELEGPKDAFAGSITIATK